MDGLSDARDTRIQSLTERLSLSPGFNIRAWQKDDFAEIQMLSANEGWTTTGLRPDEALTAWTHSCPTLVATNEVDQVIGFIRGLTDTEVTTYIADFLVVPEYRGKGLGRALLEVCHGLYPHTRFDLLSTDNAHGFYEKEGVRHFQGFRKSFE
jgi:GNAT superfamily N-acetyltransferase